MKALDTSRLTLPPGGAKPKLRTVSDLAAALLGVAQIRAHCEAVEAERKKQVNAVNEAAATARQLELDGVSQPAEQVELALLAAIERFVPEHKPEIFEDGSQTARFAGGSISWREQPATVVLDDGVKPGDIAERIVKRKKLHEQVAAVLNEAGLADILRVKFELDLQTIKRLFTDGKFKRAQLPAGLSVSADTEAVIVKPHVGPERSETGQSG